MKSVTWRCPKCGNTEKFDLSVLGHFKRGDDNPSSLEYDDSHPASCPVCGQKGTIGTFRTETKGWSTQTH
jgi:rubrerythrin